MSARLVSIVVRGVSCKASIALVLVIAAATLGTSCRARDRIQQEVAYLVGMEEYVFGFPLVMMDVTREVMTASATSDEHKAPINQFARLRKLRRRIAGRVHPGHLAGGEQGDQLAAVPAQRFVQPHDQVLPAQGVPAQRQLRAAASEKGVVTFQERQR